MRDTPAISRRLDEELVHFYAQLRSPEAKEAFQAFFEKRPADFSKI
jgi:enoyl-CoA hydratase/carnithine racemase